jgi:uncharacterized protein YyaL (SSP411 family)
MLYDNGQLMSVYAHAYQLTKNEFYKNIVKEIAAFVERDLSATEGGFYSSLNADTKDGEGEFYAWDEKEMKKLQEKKQNLSCRIISTFRNQEIGKRTKTFYSQTIHLVNLPAEIIYRLMIFTTF